jgi:hypothetical protein
VDAVRFTFLPLLLHSLALCHEKLGDLSGAYADVSRLLVVWSTADQDLPLLVEAKAMQARLAQGGGGGPGPPASHQAAK